jgi:hypothetical protein
MTFSNPIVGGTTLIRPAIHSPDYVPGVSGWSINKDGTAEFNDAVFRGELESSNYVPGVSGWHLDQDGDAEFNSIQIRSSGTETPVTVGDDDEPQIVLLTVGGVGIIALPTNRPLEDLAGGFLSGTFNQGLPSEAQTLQIFGPTSENAGDRASIFLSSQNDDGSSEANIVINTGSGTITIDEDVVTINTPTTINDPLDVNGQITATADVSVTGNLFDANSGISYEPAQNGTATANFAAVTQVDVAVVFATPFLVAPVVTCSRQNSPANSAKIMVNATAITTTGFTMRFNTGDGTAVTCTGLIGGYHAS